MDKRQFGSWWVFIVGVLIALLGVIHVAATPAIFSTMSEQLYAADLLATLYMFIATGAATIFVGLLIMYSSRGLKAAERWAWTISIAAGAFMLVVGAGAVLTMWDNPFAYLAFALAVLELVPLRLYGKDFRQS
jgi:small-conductance mechanosensitive channel